MNDKELGFSDYETYTESGETVQKNQKTTDKQIRDIVQTELKKNKKKRGGVLKVFSLVLIGAILGSMLTRFLWPTPSQTVAKTPEQVLKIEEENTSGTIENAVSKKSIRSVVGITTQVNVPSSDYFLNGAPRVVEGVGSGVVMSKDGYILTNSHVISDGQAQKIQVLTSAGKTGAGKLLWNDPTLDLAVIKTNLQNLTPADLADSNKVQLGDKAIAIGNPLGLNLQSTLTSGYISGLDRTITTEKGIQMTNLMQTDAAINPGNSGGGLFDSTGKLIGINTAKSRAEGIGFAIPIDIAKSIVDSIIETGKYEPLQIGIQGIDVLNYQQINQTKLPVDAGIVVMAIQPNSPAQQSNLQRGDIITKIDNKEVGTMSKLKQIILSKHAGEESEITFLRDGKATTSKITFEKAPVTTTNKR